MAKKRQTPPMTFTLEEARLIMRALNSVASDEAQFACRRRPMPKTSERVFEVVESLEKRFRHAEYEATGKAGEE